MSGSSGAEPPAVRSRRATEAAQLCVAIASFATRGGAAKARRHVDKAIRAGGGEPLDHVVVKVSSTGKASVYDPRRTVAGALTPALTWGIFGLLAGGLSGLALWGVVGFICGGLYAYFFEHLLSKEQLHRLGGQLPADSSALVVFAAESDAGGLLEILNGSVPRPVTASVAAIAADLKTVVESTPSLADAVTTDGLTMVIARYTGRLGARKSLADTDLAKKKDESLPHIELFIESDSERRLRVSDPTNSGAAFSIPDALSWAAFGLVWGLIVGFAGGDGVLGFIENGLVVGILWGIFGLVAGTLYGLWAGRGVSARRLKVIGPLLAPDTSTVVAWADGSVSDDAIEAWAKGSADLVSLRFIPVKGGAALIA